MQKLCLTEPGTLQILNQEIPVSTQDDNVILKVKYCGICRTDAKMWQQGHRDLVLPRVLGHEFIGVDESTGRHYTLWPGMACRTCWYCLNNRENLCDSMAIIGFHVDGGFADYVTVPGACLVSIPQTDQPFLYCLVEPVACVLNGFSSFKLNRQKKIIIYGGGVLGLIAALVAKSMGLRPVVIELSAEKIEKSNIFSRITNIEVVKETVESHFDYGINCCDSSAAFGMCLAKLKKGGQFSYFSGVSKKDDIACSLLNIIHYKELGVHGFYGPRKDHIEQAVRFCSDHLEQLQLLVEDLVSPADVPTLLHRVVHGEPFKYIIDFSGSVPEKKIQVRKAGAAALREKTMPESIKRLIDGVAPIDTSLLSRSQKKIDFKTKPLGALGKIEALAVSLSCMQKTRSPYVRKKKMLVFAGDHGVVEEGVSAFPAKVTVQMVENFLAGGAAINIFCKHYDIDLSVVDMGVKGRFDPHHLLIDKKVAPGTDNFAVGRAMSRQQAVQAIEYGAAAVVQAGVGPGDVLGLGEMGIGNTTSATAVISAVTSQSISELTGRGTGIDDEGLRRKIEVLEKALAYHKPDPYDPLDILSRVGGFELGGICGAALEAASRGCCVVLDGIISTAAGLIAYVMCPHISGYLISGHKSVEHGQKAALRHMGLEPGVDLDMRLGEGTGAAVTINMVELAAKIMCDMASFEEAGVDKKL